ncbi:MAG: hypothetical protein J6S38_03580 [Erysipelotrichaceae bacterium]|nr:hypothetical protein [Erysipelotrichaceae bacterium]MBP5279045.1 hypothetical protein [Erysipelotrichaceae bacterium]
MEFNRVEEVKAQGRFVKAIGFKPKTAPIVCIVIGVLLIAIRNIYTIILGVFFILMALLVLRLVKDYKVMDIFDEGIMVYGDKENKTACFIPFSEIKMWSIRREDGHDAIMLELESGEKLFKDTFEVDKVYRTLYSLIREKEDKYIEAQKNKDRPLSIPDALENIKRSLNIKK